MGYVQGDCEDPVPTALPAASMRALKPRQCLVVVDKPLVIVTSGGLWLDNMYIQEADDTDFALVSQLETPSELFLTSCTFQGTSGVTAGPSIGALLAKNAYAGGEISPLLNHWVPFAICSGYWREQD